MTPRRLGGGVGREGEGGIRGQCAPSLPAVFPTFLHRNPSSSTYPASPTTERITHTSSSFTDTIRINGGSFDGFRISGPLAVGFFISNTARRQFASLVVPAWRLSCSLDSMGECQLVFLVRGPH